jgi:hypothetical protein
VAAIERRIAVRRNSGDVEERELGARQAEAIAQATGAGPVADQKAVAAPVAAEQLSTAAASKPNTIYLQVYSRDQMVPAREAQSRLRQEGVAVPGIEYVGGLIRGRTVTQPGQVRFFNEEDLGQARWTAEFMNHLGGGPWTVSRIKVRQAVPKGQLELWWPTAAH